MNTIRIDEIVKKFMKIKNDEPDKIEIYEILTIKNKRFYSVISKFSKYIGHSYIFDENLKYYEDYELGITENHIFIRKLNKKNKSYEMKKPKDLKIKEMRKITELNLQDIK